MITIDTPKKDVLRIANKRTHKACTKCVHACEHTGAIFLKEDIERFAKAKGISEEEAKKYLVETELFNTKIHRSKQIKESLPHGKCIFLTDDGLCSIHEFKPLYCRIGTCEKEGEETMEWFALNFLVNKNDAESIRQWAGKLKTHPTIQGGSLNELVPDKERLRKMLNFEIL